MPHALRHQPRRSRRPALAATELAVCLPTIVMLVFAAIESCSMIYVTQALHSATYEGARTAIQRDINVVLPLDRFRELVDQKTIGSLGPSVFAFMGAQRPPYEALEASGADVGSQLRAQDIDVVFLTPT